MFVTAMFALAGCMAAGQTRPSVEETPAAARVETTPAVPADAGTARGAPTPVAAPAPAVPRPVKGVARRRTRVAAAPAPSATLMAGGPTDTKGGRSWWWLLLLILLLVAGLTAWIATRGRSGAPPPAGHAGGRGPPPSA
jgi:hypothetical protein